MTGDLNRYSFAAETVYGVFATIDNLIEGHHVEDFDVRSVRDVQMVRLTTNALLGCVMEAMEGHPDELMLPTLRQLQPMGPVSESVN
jgi:hypothetical protein